MPKRLKMFASGLLLILGLSIAEGGPGSSRLEGGPGSSRLKEEVSLGFLDRISRQLKGSDNSLSVELVGALQTWATSVGSYTLN